MKWILWIVAMFCLSVEAMEEEEEDSVMGRYFDPANVLSLNQPLVRLDVKKAFEKLTDQEKLYAHYISRASFFGGLIVLLQSSTESPQIFRLIQRINLAQRPVSLKEAFKNIQGIEDADLQAYFVYCSGIYGNMGNYKGFGDSKFVPDLTSEKMELLVNNSQAWSDDPQGMNELWTSVKASMWSLSNSEKQLGLGEKGVTKYFSDNCNQEDGEKVNRFFKQNNLEGFNNRVIKTEQVDGTVQYEIRNGAVENSVLQSDIMFEGANFKITTGDYNELLQLVVENLNKAKDYAANDKEAQMLNYYAQSFIKGSLEAHKNGSREWIANKSPNVETYIGFIETYRDPMGVRAEFEGFVAMVNKDQSEKLKLLVEKAQNFLPSLPWTADFEKDVYLKPDYTSLDVLSFSGSLIPAGINIPNYDEIRQSEGFKNVNLGNVIEANMISNLNKSRFLSPEDHDLMLKYKSKGFEVVVGLHELLGHGSGKLLRVDANGIANYDVDKVINPLTGLKIDPSTVYQEGETFDTKFTTIGSSYEECRAESVAHYLCFEHDILTVFGHNKNISEDLIYVIWLSGAIAGIKGLEHYNPDSKEWKQAHSRGHFAILQVLLEAGDQFVRVEEIKGQDGKPDLLLTMDRKKLRPVGRPAIGKFLLKLQVYKSTANVNAATEMYENYTRVDNSNSALPWAKWRDIVLARKLPRVILVQSNTFVRGDGQVELVDYEPSAEGMVESWINRFSIEEHKQVDSILKTLYEKDLPHFLVKQ